MRPEYERNTLRDEDDGDDGDGEGDGDGDGGKVQREGQRGTKFWGLGQRLY